MSTTPTPSPKRVLWKVVVDDGKYAVRFLEDGHLLADHYSDDWRDCTGDNLVYWLCVELLQAKAELGKLREDEVPA